MSVRTKQVHPQLPGCRRSVAGKDYEWPRPLAHDTHGLNVPPRVDGMSSPDVEYAFRRLRTYTWDAQQLLPGGSINVHREGVQVLYRNRCLGILFERQESVL